MNYENKALCARCEGQCCRSQPGAAWPEDFDTDNLLTSLVEAFQSGDWAIDWWEDDLANRGQDRTYFVRPATKANPSLFDPTWGGECIFLGPKGCKLSIERRPKNCRELEPVESDHCIDHSGGKKAAAIAWVPYEGVILEAGEQCKRVP